MQPITLLSPFYYNTSPCGLWFLIPQKNLGFMDQGCSCCLFHQYLSTQKIFIGLQYILDILLNRYQFLPCPHGDYIILGNT